MYFVLILDYLFGWVLDRTFKFQDFFSNWEVLKYTFLSTWPRSAVIWITQVTLLSSYGTVCIGLRGYDDGNQYGKTAHVAAVVIFFCKTFHFNFPRVSFQVESQSPDQARSNDWFLSIGLRALFGFTLKFYDTHSKQSFPLLAPTQVVHLNTLESSKSWLTTGVHTTDTVYCTIVDSADRGAT